MNLALGKTRWSDSPQPVELGLDENGIATLIADRAGTVTGTWSLRGRHDSDGQLAFRFELPRAALSTLLLTVPPGIVPTAGTGLASLVEEQAERHVYRLLLGGASELSLRLPLEPVAVPNQPKLLLRESAVYNLSAPWARPGGRLETGRSLDPRPPPGSGSGSRTATGFGAAGRKRTSLHRADERRAGSLARYTEPA